MIKIGDFSKLAHVTVKTLRHYGRLGLLKPTWIDRFSGYRYYSLRQLPRLNRILALKELGFSLEQISQMLDGEVLPQQLRQMLCAHQADLAHHLVEEQQRLAQVEARIRQIELEQTMPHYEVVLKKVAPLTVASLQETVESIDLLPQRCELLRQQIQSWLKQAGCKESGTWMLINHNREYMEQNIKVEVALLTEDCSTRKLPNGLRKQNILHTEPGADSMASVIHTGSDSTIAEAYTALYTWVETNVCRIIGPVREMHYVEVVKEADQDRDGDLIASVNPEVSVQVVEVQMPVERISMRRTPQRLPNEQTQKENDMEPTIVTKPAFMVVGLKYVGKNLSQEIAQLWRDFFPYWEKIKNKIENGVLYGICQPVEGAADGEFEYVAGVEVTKVDALSDPLVVRFIPESKYAVFTHQGSMEKFKDTFHYAYQEWLPQSGYQLTGTPDFEYYDEKFDDFSEKSIVYIYVPIK